MNVVRDDKARTVFLPVTDAANVCAFNPGFSVAGGWRAVPSGPQNFCHGAVTYTLSGPGTVRHYLVRVAVNNNPVIQGYYADPDILYSEKHHRYYLYPTSDGFNNWMGTYFEAFSSTDLIHWKKEGKILDLPTQLKWAHSRAWAPTAAEVKQPEGYRYYFYFCAGQKIGVAISDSPTGPFVDSGKPLIDHFPNGVTGGQQIDPAVFSDPVSGKHYLYWGNGYMAVAELNPDMVSLKPGTTKVLTPDKTFREGTKVFYRKGIYYFMWSENDTRDPSYRVRYATAKSPTGPLTIPKDNLVIHQNPKLGIYATGHNSVIQQTGTDHWFLIYHRFSRPDGIKMGRAAGFHREVCIDEMHFAPDGSILPVEPTLKGIQPLKISSGR